MADSVNFSVRLPANLLETIKSIANDNDKSTNLMIVRLLEFAVENFKSENLQDDDLRARVEALEKAVAELQRGESE